MEEQTTNPQPTPVSGNQPEVLTTSPQPQNKGSKTLIIVIGVLVLAALVIGGILLVAYPRGNSNEVSKVTTTPSKEIRDNSDLDKVNSDLDAADSDFAEMETSLTENDQDSSEF